VATGNATQQNAAQGKTQGWQMWHKTARLENARLENVANSKNFLQTNFN